MGVGGITRDRASFAVRDINEYGFLETPYRKIVLEKGKQRVTDDVVYLSADDEEDFHITEATIPLDEKGFMKEDRIPVRYRGTFYEGKAEEVSLIDISPQQIFGISASLIPFLANDDANRALMGTQMQCQAVPLLIPSAPIVGTGMEAVVANNMGRIVRAPEDGVVTYVDGNKLVLKASKNEYKYEIKK